MDLHLLLREHRLALPDDPELLAELANVRLRETTPGVFRLDHDAGKHDDRAVSLGLAALALTERPPTGRGSVTVPAGRAPKRSNDTAARPALPRRLGVVLAARGSPRGLPGGAIVGALGAHDEQRR